ncbi:MAG: ComF family protein [Candidatus Margulisbacteria bacterium]|nr:ComF family protein [Candidatus Margulisiibacteriota bacterium]MBU1616178.1 ComF family protein [Candidatus Margulisiibacteriota bacterium]MBU1867590.1 ComF family protein [Candidatus Margulisiibacteriota bacterium]
MFWQSLLDLIFPPRCEVCKKPGNEALCPDCFNQISFMKPALGIYSATKYAGVIRSAIQRLKFSKRRRLAEPLGVLLVKYVSHTPVLNMREIDTLIPVPLHPRRHKLRGFNQAELLTVSLAKYYDTPAANALVRVKETTPQFDLPRDARLVNVKGAFKVADPRAVYNKRVLLIDDIYTTGATIAECSRSLMIAGAKRVEVLTLSRAMSESD